MRSILFLGAFLAVGCVSTTSAQTTPAATPSANKTQVVPATTCTTDDSCPTGLHCVKPANSGQGACSTLPMGDSCSSHGDCMTGAFCYTFGSNGVCYHP